MKKRTLIALLIFAGLLAAAIVLMRQKPERNITRLSFATLDKEKVDRLEIAGKNPMEATRKAGKWVLADGRDAEESAIKAVLDTIGRLDTSDVATTSAERFAELEVDEAKGTRVKVSAGASVVAEFVIGKSTPAGTYVRQGDSVYTAKGVYGHVFSKPAGQWHHLKLFADKLDDIARVEVAVGGSAPYALVKKEDKWQLEDAKVVPEGFRFDEGAARALANALLTVTAKDIADKDPGVEATRLDAKADVLAFVAKDGTRRELHLGGPGADKSVWAQVSGSSDVYSLAEPMANGLRKKPTDLRDLKLMKLDKEKVQKLEIFDGKSKLVLEKQGADWKITSATETVPADFTPDPAAVERRLATLVGARALKPAPDAAPAGLDKPTGKIVATIPGGTAVLAFGAAGTEETPNSVFARGNADADTYLVGKWIRDQLLGGVATFKKQAAPARQFDPSALRNLPPEVRANLMQQMARQKAPGTPMRFPPPALPTPPAPAPAAGK